MEDVPFEWFHTNIIFYRDAVLGHNRGQDGA